MSVSRTPCRGTGWNIRTVLALGVLGAIALPARAQTIAPEELTDEHVRLAIETIVEELYRRQDERRFWEPSIAPSGQSEQDGGHTALAVLALVSAGESYQDPRLREAIAYLQALQMNGVYALTVRTMLWASLPPRFKGNLESDAQRLLAGFSHRARGWDYRMNPVTTRQDNSIRQFGALALWEASKRGIAVEDRFWRTIEEGFLRLQLQDGGWNYTGSGRATGSMTAAGLATLFITQDLLHSARAAELAERDAAPHEAAMTRGLDWMGRNFSPTGNPGRDQYFYYYLYGVERVALAGGYKYLGGHDWYRDGAVEIIRRLCAWDEDAGAMTVYERTAGNARRAPVRIDDLAFGLMFLSRGRAPVAINKLRDDSFRWNNRPRDVANLCAWLSDEAAQQLNWQIVDIDSPVEEWLDAPMLWLASNQAAPWIASSAPAAHAAALRAARERQKRLLESGELIEHAPIEHERLAKIKRYLDLGGLLFAVSEGPQAAARQFAASIERAGQIMYPEYEWRDLTPNHWAYAARQPVRGRLRLRGLSNGVRELIILAPGDDLTATFQKRSQDRGGLAHHHIASNIYFHASEMNRTPPRLAALARGPQPEIPDAAGESPLRIVRAAYAGNWNSEPLALARLREWLADGEGPRIHVEARSLGAVADLAPAPDLVIVGGTDRHEFTPAEREAARRYVDSGGTILFETTGGIGAFAQAAEEQMSELFRAPVRSLLRHRIITGAELDSGAALEQVEYRPYTLNVMGSLDTTPRLRAISVGDRPALLFSRDDLSHALLAQPRWEISGYSTESARALLRNILLHVRPDPVITERTESLEDE